MAKVNVAKTSSKSKVELVVRTEASTGDFFVFLKVQAIITQNYDTLVEQACTSVDVACSPKEKRFGPGNDQHLI